MISAVKRRLLQCSSKLHLHARYMSHSIPLINRIGSKDLAERIALINDDLPSQSKSTGSILSSKHVTYHQLDTISSKIASKISGERLDWSKQLRVGCFTKPNPVGFTAALLACAKLNAVCVPLCITHSHSEIEYFLNDSAISVIVCNRREELHSEIASKQNLIFIELADEALDHIQTTVFPNNAKQSMDDDALIIYTSGTTGRPKGVVHSHSTLDTMMRSLMSSWKYSHTDRILHFLPLYHMHGLVNKLLTTLYAGGQVHFLPSANAKFLWNFLAEERSLIEKNHQYNPLSLFMAVPTIYVNLLQESSQLKAETRENALQTIKNMRVNVCGSAALPDNINDRWERLTGQQILERYGMTEIGMALTNPYDSDSGSKGRKKGSVGLPMPFVECRLVQDNHDDISDGIKDSIEVINSPNVSGELQVKGGTVFKRYLNNPVATKETFTEDGQWFKTGDIAHRDEDNYYKILGRRSADIIKSSGYKLSALEIEREILDHPQVIETAVIGLPHETLGEEVVAIIALKANAQTIDAEIMQQDIQQFLRDRLAKYKMPRKYFFVAEIPRNHLGKVNKKMLVQEFRSLNK